MVYVCIAELIDEDSGKEGKKNLKIYPPVNSDLSHLE